MFAHPYFSTKFYYFENRRPGIIELSCAIPKHDALLFSFAIVATARKFAKVAHKSTKSRVILYMIRIKRKTDSDLI